LEQLGNVTVLKRNCEKSPPWTVRSYE